MSSGINFTWKDAHRAADKVRIPQGKKRAPHRTACYSLDGKNLFIVKLPRHECADGTKRSIVSSFRLSEGSFKRLYECSLTRNDFEKHIRGLIKKGLL